MVNRELLNRYHLLQLLHHGVGGEVWLAEHTGLSAKRLLKVIEKSHPQYNALSGEAKYLQQCRHSSIPIIYDILDFDTQTCIIEEYIEGETLKQFAQRKRILSDSCVLNFSMQLCESLLILHNPARPILHLDLKPENILISDQQVKLIDFGSAIFRNSQDAERAIFGTPAYCAPEMKRGEPLSEKTDIYSLGRCMEFMMLYMQSVPKQYRHIVNRCLRREGKEYTYVDQVRGDLERLKKRKWKAEPEVWYAVSGVLSPQEGTAAALQLAVYLKKKYHRPVLYLDCSKEHLVELLEQEEPEEGKRRSFVFEREGITFAKRVALQEIRGWRQRNFSFVVCDLGVSTPIDSAGIFSAVFHAGSLTELTDRIWQERLLTMTEWRNVLLLTGGDIHLAEELFGEKYRICRMECFGDLFHVSKTFSRQMKGL